jgi:hypothetical protein
MIPSLRFPLIALAALCGATPLASMAEEEELTWYAVEVIVFERTSETGRGAEAWPVDPGLPDLADAIELTAEGLSPEQLAGSPAGEAPAQPDTAQPDTAQPKAVPDPIGAPRAFQLVPEEAYRLTEAWKRLDKSSAFRPLLHIAWVQPGYPSEQARLVHVRNANAALGTVEASVDEDLQTPPVDDDFGFAATLSPRVTVARDPSEAALDGTLRVHRARYLHVQADLLYYRPLAGDTGAKPGNDTTQLPDSPDTGLIEQLLAEADPIPRLFRLSESRRMRSSELHYLDHPLFGMLVEIVPLELPDMPEQAVLPVEGETPQEQGDTSTQPQQTQSGGSG